ncbi:MULTISPECIES: hypothetical protein [Citrobacter]|uniref:Uncharacterized protein n=1 Tax=Citrobacter cronae TaxID=1748967 RepID=A0A7X1BTB1_9ENTR|nr:hypothetical protein [Citrobacter cronae]EBZ5074346.1 hypothetical protein [Salmonella enterica subsp. enterica serovar Typhimurium]EEB8458292.1 hypothetical protein [Salmonella enterica]ECL7522431.1 hypothetical protein [Salmonella enterica subsp. enterica serovar Typhimurium]EDN3714133.1 hypothetical protein [Salmonella enterica subsp. enterica serovar Typhimurium]EEF6236560.1 hypothetical protein [Salmonella enterica]
MSENSADVREDAKKRVSNVVSDRLKDGFYGYLVTAFFIGNWQNIFMLFKSKKPIEETINNITSQPDFLTQYFWLPLLYGTLAAFIMPWIIVGYVRLVANARSRIKSAERAADAAREEKLAKSALKTQLLYNQKSNLADLLDQQRQEHKTLKDEIAIYQSSKQQFDKYFNELNALYSKVPKIENEEHFALFFKTASENNVFDYYKETNLSMQVKSGNILKVINSPSIAPQITAKPPQM